MITPDERLREFQAAYKEDFGEDITLAEAREMLHRLVFLYEALSKPVSDKGNSFD